MPVLPDAVHLRFGEFVGTFAFEWATDEVRWEGVPFPVMHHLPSDAKFVIGDDDAPPDGALPRYALLVSSGDLSPEDRATIVYLGRAAVWFHVQQIPEVRAILAETGPERHTSG